VTAICGPVFMQELGWWGRLWATKSTKLSDALHRVSDKVAQGQNQTIHDRGLFDGLKDHNKDIRNNRVETTMIQVSIRDFEYYVESLLMILLCS